MRKPFGAALLAALLVGLGPPAAQAGFNVTPIRVDLDRGATGGAITVANDGDETLGFQVNAMAWSQDADGNDAYEDTQDLVFFPKLLNVEPNASRVVRVGFKVPAATAEKTYRLFIEQLPPPRKDGPGEGKNTAQVSVLIRFGVPVFLHPLERRPAGEAAELGIVGGKAFVLIRNTGNGTFRIQKITFRGFDGAGKEVLTKEMDGWYLMHGATRRYGAEIPAEVCPSISRLTVSAKTDQVELQGSVEIKPGQCPH